MEVYKSLAVDVFPAFRGVNGLRNGFYINKRNLLRGSKILSFIKNRVETFMKNKDLYF